jgi:hypothetical protein
MATKVLLQEVLDALEMAGDEMSSYVNLDTGQVLSVGHEELRLAEEEDPDPNQPEWQRDLVAEAKLVLEGERWIELPGKVEIHEWDMMRRFGLSLSDASAREEVADAIHGAGAFRAFKSAIRRIGLEAAWFAYREKALETIARDFLEDHDLEVDERRRAEKVASPARDTRNASQ